MTIQLFNAGLFYADGGAMFGAVPRTAWGRRYEADHLNRCVLAMQIGLVRVEDRILLIDTGVGTKHLERLSRSYYAFHQLTDPTVTLTRLGIRPDDVTDVILTHLHFDHCGGTTRMDNLGRIVATYPRARVHVSRAQLDACAAPNALEEDSFSIDHIDAIRQAGLLSPIDTPETLIHPLIRLTLHDGHTDGQIAGPACSSPATSSPRRPTSPPLGSRPTTSAPWTPTASAASCSTRPPEITSA